MGSRNTNISVFQNVDWVVIVIYLLLVIAGAISIYAASYDFDNASIFDFNEFSGKQIRWIGLALVLGLVILLIDKRMLETYAYPIYIAILLLLIVTIGIAPNIKGSHSWLVLGPVSLQPAEFGKFATALALAKLFSTYNFSLNARPMNYVKALSIIFVPIALILAQNETGSALAYLALVFVLYREGMSGLVLFAALFAVVIFVVTVKFTTSAVMGIPSGEFAVFILIMATMVAMVAIYSKSLIASRNLAAIFGISGIAVTICGLCQIEVPGVPYFIATIAVGSIYLIYELIKNHLRRMLVPIATALISVVFMFSVNYFFNNVLQPHQQMRIKVTLGIENDLLGKGYNVNQSKDRKSVV